MKNKTFYISLASLLFAGVLFTACKKTENLGPMRQFTPGGDISSSSGEKSVKLTWKAAVNAAPDASYKVIVSRDSLFAAGPEFTYTTDTSGIVLSDADLKVRTDYFARIRTLGPDSTLDSKWLHSKRFQIAGEQIFLPVTSNDLTDIAVILKWKPYEGLTSITLTPAGGGAPITVALDPADLAAEQKMISGLAGNKQYAVEIFKGDQSKGLISITTKLPLEGANIIDLRGITGQPTVLADTLGDIAEGSTVVLKRSYTYTIGSSISLSKSVTFVSGYDFSTELAIIDFVSYFNIAANSNIGAISFKDVVLKGNSYSGGYVFNVNNPCTIARLSFEGCRGGIFRGMVRLQTAAINVTDFLIDNCIIDSISNYGVVNVDNVNCKIANIAIRNSTIFKCEKVITSKQASTSCVIENCTINQAPFGNNFLIDYATAGSDLVSNGIAVRNSILGIGKNNGGNTSPKGIRTNAGTSVSSSNTYNTSDYIVASNPIPGLIPYTAASTALWQDPVNGNFKIIDNAFPGAATAGDPRWKP